MTLTPPRPKSLHKIRTVGAASVATGREKLQCQPCMRTLLACFAGWRRHPPQYAVLHSKNTNVVPVGQLCGQIPHDNSGHRSSRAARQGETHHTNHQFHLRRHNGRRGPPLGASNGCKGREDRHFDGKATIASTFVDPIPRQVIIAYTIITLCHATG